MSLNTSLSETDLHNQKTIADAAIASNEEHQMTLRQAIKKYPGAILFTCLLMLSVIMDGYDIGIVGSFLSLPQFTKRFGEEVAPGAGIYTLTSSWQSAIGNGASAGAIIGALINGWASDRFGYRKTMAAALLWLVGANFILFFAKSVGMIVAGTVLIGLSWGVFLVLSTTYASELAPMVLRPYLLSSAALFTTSGNLLATGVVRGTLNIPNDYAWRIPYAIQWFWPIPLMAVAAFAPESPYWLVRKGRISDAQHAVGRLTSSRAGHFDQEQHVALIVHTNELEKNMAAGTEWLDLFRGTNRRRTMIACGIMIVSQFCGAAFAGYCTYFLVLAGLSSQSAFNVSVGQAALGVVGTIVSWSLMPRFGRRSLYLSGLSIIFVLLLTVGFLGLKPGDSAVTWAVGGLLLVTTGVFSVFVSPVSYPIVLEISSTRLRSKTTSLARACFAAGNIINQTVLPRFLNPFDLNWGAKTGWFWAGTCALCLIWTFFCLPETKGRTFGDIDILFEKRVATRNFKHAVISEFQHDGEHAQPEKQEISHIQLAHSA